MAMLVRPDDDGVYALLPFRRSHFAELFQNLVVATIGGALAVI